MPTALHSVYELQERLKRLKIDRETATRHRDAAEYYLQNLLSLEAKVEQEIIAAQGES